MNTIDSLRDAVDRLKILLDDPHPGLITWQTAREKLMDDIADLGRRKSINLARDEVEALKLLQSFSGDIIASYSLAREYDLKKIAYAIDLLLCPSHEGQGRLAQNIT
jgi:hypothetical protein